MATDDNATHADGGADQPTGDWDGRPAPREGGSRARASLSKSVSAFPTHATSDGAFPMSLYGLARDPLLFLAVVKAFGAARAIRAAGRLPSSIDDRVAPLISPLVAFAKLPAPSTAPASSRSRQPPRHTGV